MVARLEVVGERHALALPLRLAQGLELLAALGDQLVFVGGRAGGVCWSDMEGRRRARCGRNPDFRFLREPCLLRSIIRAMFLKAGALSLALLLASRLLGLVRESAQAAAFGASGLADVAVLMLTLPDWLAGVLASGALAYVLVPAWAGRAHGQVAASAAAGRAWVLLAAGGLLALAAGRSGARPLVRLAGAAAARRAAARRARRRWSGARWRCPRPCSPPCGPRGCSTSATSRACIRPTWWSTAVLIAAHRRWLRLGAGERSSVAGWARALLAAMLLRLAWLRWRQRRCGGCRCAAGTAARCRAARSGCGRRCQRGLAAGAALRGAFDRLPVGRGRAGHLQLRLEAGRAAADPGGPAGGDAGASRRSRRRSARGRCGGEAAMRRCAAPSRWPGRWPAPRPPALLVGAPAVAQLLFGWGRMEPEALARVAQWGAIGAGACCRRR